MAVCMAVRWTSTQPAVCCASVVQVLASDLQGNIEKLNNGIAFLIRHSQKLFKVFIHIIIQQFYLGLKSVIKEEFSGIAILRVTCVNRMS